MLLASEDIKQKQNERTNSCRQIGLRYGAGSSSAGAAAPGLIGRTVGVPDWLNYW